MCRMHMHIVSTHSVLLDIGSNVDGENQPAASQISEMDTLLNHAQDKAMPVVEWVLTPIGHCKLKEEYARVIASTNHLEIPCFAMGPPLARLPKLTNSCSDLLFNESTLRLVDCNDSNGGPFRALSMVGKSQGGTVKIESPHYLCPQIGQQ